MTLRSEGGPATGTRRRLPTQLAALAVGVPEATIRKWASRGRLTRYGRPGRAEYDLEELYRIVVERRVQSKSPADLRGQRLAQ